MVPFHTLMGFFYPREVPPWWEGLGWSVPNLVVPPNPSSIFILHLSSPFPFSFHRFISRAPFATHFHSFSLPLVSCVNGSRMQGQTRNNKEFVAIRIARGRRGCWSTHGERTPNFLGLNLRVHAEGTRTLKFFYWARVR